MTPVNQNGKLEGAVNQTWNPDYDTSRRKKVTLTVICVYDQKGQKIFCKTAGVDPGFLGLGEAWRYPILQNRRDCRVIQGRDPLPIWDCKLGDYQVGLWARFQSWWPDAGAQSSIMRAQGSRVRLRALAGSRGNALENQVIESRKLLDIFKIQALLCSF